MAGPGRHVWALLRIAAGLMLLPHGVTMLIALSGETGRAAMAAGFDGLGLRPPLLWCGAAALADTAIGLLVALGLFTRVAAAGGVVVMAVIAAVMAGNGWVWIARGAEYPVLWGLVFLFFATNGAGPWSLDARAGRV